MPIQIVRKTNGFIRAMAIVLCSLQESRGDINCLIDSTAVLFSLINRNIIFTYQWHVKLVGEFWC